MSGGFDLNGLQATENENLDELLQAQPARVFLFDALVRRLNTGTQVFRHGKRADRGLRQRSSSVLVGLGRHRL